MRRRALSTPWVLLTLLLTSGCLSTSTPRGGAEVASGRQHRTRVVMLSIDGLRPDYIHKADDYGLKVPTLRRLLKEGASATAVTSVLPALTYPCHATLLTGTHPAEHGIVNNYWFDPLAHHRDAWFFFAEDIRRQTLWQVATRAKLATLTVDWPVSIGAQVTWNIPEYWGSGREMDPKHIRAFATPGIMAEVERACGAVPLGQDYTVKADQVRACFAVHLLKTRQPDFATLYLGSLDTQQHAFGPSHPSVLGVLEKIDRLIADIWTAARTGVGDRLHFVLVSDHGFSAVSKEIRLNVALRRAGLLTVDEAKGRRTAWQAWAAKGHGMAAVYLKDSKDDQLRGKVAALLEELAKDPKNGIAWIHPGGTPPVATGFPKAAFVLSARPGFAFSSASHSGEVVGPCNLKGTHGYPPSQAEMDTSFLAVGPGIAPGRDLKRISLVDVAPTVAHLLGVRLPQATGRNVLE
jgi:predicted AlkP superfamily pyrophosphatase or phosphodiesterase